MTANQKIIDKLIKAWKKADAVWKKAAKIAHGATAKYHWTAADDGWKWKQVIALRDRETAAFKKADAAWNALVAATRRALADKKR